MLDSGESRFRLDESGTLLVSSSVETIHIEWYGNDSIRRIKFEPNPRLKEIGGFVFCRFRNLVSVSIPTSVEKIGPGAFSQCPRLKKLIFARGSRLRIIKGFGNCRSLSRVEIPASVEEIGSGAFSGCAGLVEVIFATDSRLRIVDGFLNCKSLSRVEIPASVERIGFWAFACCSELTEMVFVTGPSVNRIRRYGEYGSLPLRGHLWRPELIFRSGTRVIRNTPQDCFRGFITFEDANDLKRRRRQVQTRPYAACHCAFLFHGTRP
jgi:hypothetical protein